MNSSDKYLYQKTSSECCSSQTW